MNESVKKALEAITKHINISTGFIDQNDKECTVASDRAEPSR